MGIAALLSEVSKDANSSEEENSCIRMLISDKGISILAFSRLKSDFNPAYISVKSIIKWY
jgi:hypothetical protein